MKTLLASRSISTLSIVSLLIGLIALSDANSGRRREPKESEISESETERQRSRKKHR